MHDEHLTWLWPVFITTPEVPNKLIDAFLTANAEELPGNENNTSNFTLEIIPSRSGIDAQLEAHRATLPFLEGSKPPYMLPAAQDLEDTFFNATIEELAAFVVQKLHGAEDDVFSPHDQFDSHFFILDVETVREGSMILVSMEDVDDDEEDSEGFDDEFDNSDEMEQRRRLAGEKVGMGRLGKKKVTKASLLNGVGDEKRRRGSYNIHAVRVGLAIGSTWAQTIEVTSFDVNGLKMGCGQDGVYWGCDHCEEEEPPPMEERCGMREKGRKEKQAT